MELPRHRPDPTRQPTIWICGPRAYTLCTFLIKRYCNCGLTSKHHGLHYRQPPPSVPVLHPDLLSQSFPPVDFPLFPPPPSLGVSFESSPSYTIAFVLNCRLAIVAIHHAVLPWAGERGRRRLTLRDAVTWSQESERPVHSVSNWFDIGNRKRN